MAPEGPRHIIVDIGICCLDVSREFDVEGVSEAQDSVNLGLEVGEWGLL